MHRTMLYTSPRGPHGHPIQYIHGASSIRDGLFLSLQINARQIVAFKYDCSCSLISTFESEKYLKKVSRIWISVCVCLHKVGKPFREQSADELFETRLRNIERSQLEQRTLWPAAEAEFHYRRFRGLFIIL